MLKMYLIHLMLQMDYTIPLNNNSSLFADLQTIKQFAVLMEKCRSIKNVFLKGSKSLTFGARVGWRNKHWETSLNITVSHLRGDI